MSDPVREFANSIIDAYLEGGELDAYEIEELASNLGLIEGKSVTEECDEFCRCAEGEFPTICYHKSKLLEGPPAGEPQHVYCPGCSQAGGADRPIYHLPPICGPQPQAPEETK